MTSEFSELLGEGGRDPSVKPNTEEVIFNPIPELERFWHTNEEAVVEWALEKDKQAREEMEQEELSGFRSLVLQHCREDIQTIIPLVKSPKHRNKLEEAVRKSGFADNSTAFRQGIVLRDIHQDSYIDEVEKELIESFHDNPGSKKGKNTKKPAKPRLPAEVAKAVKSIVVLIGEAKDFIESFDGKTAPEETEEYQKSLIDRLEKDLLFRSLATVLMLREKNAEQIAESLFGKKADGRMLVFRGLSMYRSALLMGRSVNARAFAGLVNEPGQKVYQPYLKAGNAAFGAWVRDTNRGQYMISLSRDLSGSSSREIRGFGPEDLASLPRALRIISGVAFYEEIATSVDDTDTETDLALEMVELAAQLVEAGLERLGSSASMGIYDFAILHPEIPNSEMADIDKRVKTIRAGNFSEEHGKRSRGTSQYRQQKLFRYN